MATQKYEVDNAYDDENNLHHFDNLVLLDRGGFGSVYKATHVPSGQTFAIKRVEVASVIRSENAFHLTREKRALRHLSHTNIMKLQRAFKAFDKGVKYCYFIMEYCPHGNLYTWVTELDGFRLKVNQFYSAELVLALEYIRSQNFVHRDLKPINLFLDINWHLKVGDFGLAKRIGDLRGKKDQRTATRVGTPCYMAPEILRPDAETTFSSDLWGLGGCIYEFHTATPPFEYPRWNYGKDAVEADIRAGRYKWIKRQTDRHLQDIIAELLIPLEKRRLGYKGYEEVKEHAFFRGIEWSTLHKQVPPTFVGPDPDPSQPPAHLDLQPPMTGYRRRGPIQPALPARPPTLQYFGLDPPEDRPPLNWNPDPAPRQSTPEFTGPPLPPDFDASNLQDAVRNLPVLNPQMRRTPSPHQSRTDLPPTGYFSPGALPAVSPRRSSSHLNSPGGAAAQRPQSPKEMKNIDKMIAKLDYYGPAGKPNVPKKWMDLPDLWVPSSSDDDRGGCPWKVGKSLTPPPSSSSYDSYGPPRGFSPPSYTTTESSGSSSSKTGSSKSSSPRSSSPGSHSSRPRSPRPDTGPFEPPAGPPSCPEELITYECAKCETYRRETL